MFASVTTCMLLGVAAGPAVLDLAGVENRVALTPFLLVLDDPGQQLTLADVRSPAWRSRFLPMDGTRMGTGIDEGAVWFRLDVHGDERPTAWLLEVENPLHDLVELHVQVGEGAVLTRQAGTVLPFLSRDVPSDRMVLPLEVPAAADLRLWVRVKSSTARLMGMTLWDRGAWASHDHVRRLFLGLFYGIMLAAILYNLLLLLVLRESAYLHFVQYLTSMTLVDAILTGVAGEYVATDRVWPVKTFLAFAACMAGVSAVLLTRSYLGTRQHAPAHDRWLRAVAWGGAALAMAGVGLDYPVAIRLAVATAMAAYLFSVVATWRCFKTGVSSSGYFLLAQAVLLPGVAPAMLRPFWQVDAGVMAEHGLQISTGLMAMIFTLGLGERIRGVERQRQQAQQDALRVQKAAQERTEALNVQLEARVRERTAELEAKNLELAQLNARKDELVATVSHDFRSPLAVIRQNVQTLLRDLRAMDPADQEALLRAVERQEGRLSVMCGQLLDLARLRAAVAKRVALDLGDVAVRVVESSQPLAQRAGVALRCPTPAPAPMEGDPGGLERLIQNLVDNAIRFTPHGGSVDVTVQTQDHLVHLRVQDTGVGIPAEAMGRLFDPFFQVPGASPPGQGSGLGLAIVRAVAEVHGGTVTAESAPGRGTTFLVRLPGITLIT